MKKTDIVIIDGEGKEFGFECKRPKKISTILRNVREARNQLKRKKLDGIVLINLEFLHKEWVIVDDPSLIRKKCEHQIQSIVNQCKAPEDKNTRVIFYSNFLTLYPINEQRDWIINTLLITQTFANPTIPNISIMLEFFEKTLHLGQDNLFNQPLPEVIFKKKSRIINYLKKSFLKLYQWLKKLIIHRKQIKKSLQHL